MPEGRAKSSDHENPAAFAIKDEEGEFAWISASALIIFASPVLDEAASLTRLICRWSVARLLAVPKHTSASLIVMVERSINEVRLKRA